MYVLEPQLRNHIVQIVKHGVKPSTVAHCFQRGQVKYSPANAPANDIEEVAEEIYECIRVAHPGFQRARLPEFIDSVDEVFENSAEEEEQRILDTYEPAPLHESDSDPDDTPDVPVISYLAVLKPSFSSVFKIRILI